MAKLPAVTKNAEAVTRLSIGSALALTALIFPPAALIAPAANMLLDRTVTRPRRILEEALARGEVLDLSDEQAVAFVQMAERYSLAARQGEYDRNLKLLAAFLTAELKSDACEPGSFLDMARRVEALTATSLKAITLIDEWMDRPQEPGGAPKSFTVLTLSSADNFAVPLSLDEANDAVADLASRGFLPQSGTGWGGGDFYSTTSAFHRLVSRARDVIEEATRN